MLEAAAGVKRDGDEYSVAEEYNLSVYIGDPGQAMTMDEIERRAILDALEKTGGNRTQAAEMLGIGLRTLQRKLKDYRLAGRADGK